MKLRYRILRGALVVLVLAFVGLALTVRYESPCPTGPQAAPAGETMKAVVHRCYGAAEEALALQDTPKPNPAPNEVLVRVHAAGVNPYDWHTMRGSPYLMRLASGIGAPSTSSFGVDFSGTVEAVGAEVTKFRPGDRVFGGRSGAFAEYLTVGEERAVAHVPDGVSLEEAGTVGMAAITALQALRDHGRVQPGDRVLVNGASGGVGTFAVQIAKALGAEVTGVCSTRNVEMVRALGADRVIDYTRENYLEQDARYDVIIDTVGNHAPQASARVTRPDGRVVLVGGLKGDWLAPFARPVQTLIHAPFVEPEMTTMLARFSQEDLEYLATLMAEGQLRAEIGERYTLAQLPEAIALSETGRARGKLVIRVE